MTPAPLVASAETKPRSIRSMSTGDEPGLDDVRADAPDDAAPAVARRAHRRDHRLEIRRRRGSTGSESSKPRTPRPADTASRNPPRSPCSSARPADRCGRRRDRTLRRGISRGSDDYTVGSVELTAVAIVAILPARPSPSHVPQNQHRVPVAVEPVALARPPRGTRRARARGRRTRPPASAATTCGRWKFVSSRRPRWKSKPGIDEDRRVRRARLRRARRRARAASSSARVVVVPTAITRRPSCARAIDRVRGLRARSRTAPDRRRALRRARRAPA